MNQYECNLNLNTLWIGVALCFLAMSNVNAQSTDGCGPLRSQSQYGPYDARTDLDKLPLVLGAHFSPAVESLIRGDTNRSLGADIDYTLRAIPNYHRALISMMRLGERDKTDKPRDVRYTVECWFIRAVSFAPNDPIVRMIYSTYLNSKNRAAEGSAQLDAATSLAKDNGFTHYNIGLHYFDLKNYDKALIQAHKAMALDFPKTELQEQLRNLGKWTDPTGTAADSANPVSPIAPAGEAAK